MKKSGKSILGSCFEQLQHSEARFKNKLKNKPEKNADVNLDNLNLKISPNILVTYLFADYYFLVLISLARIIASAISRMVLRESMLCF